jgi:hypothetical protein
MGKTSSFGFQLARLSEMIKQERYCRISSSTANDSQVQKGGGAAGGMQNLLRPPGELPGMPKKAKRERNVGFVLS